MLPITSGLSSLIDGPSESVSTAEHLSTHWTTEGTARQGCITIDVLPDNVLLNIFDFSLYDWSYQWEKLIHVCRRWRHIVFGSPCRLQLQLFCTGARSVRTMLDIWPPSIPIVVRVLDVDSDTKDEILPALEQKDRICEIYIDVLKNHSLDFMVERMNVSFPELTRFELRSYSDGALVVPDSFLGESAPRLRSLCVKGVVFLALPKLLSSATGLVRLHFEDIPRAGYISPETIADCLSAMTRLEDLLIGFRSARCRPDPASRRPPLTRIGLPMLTVLSFQGAYEYLEDLVSRLDTPSLNRIITKFLTPIIFDTPRISLFLSRTEPFEGLTQAYVFLFGDFVEVTLVPRQGTTGRNTHKLLLIYKDLAWQLRYLSLTQSGRSFGDGRELDHQDPPVLGDNMQSARWLDLLRLFTAVEDIYIDEDLAFWFAPALRGLDKERITEVLPALRNFFVGSIQPSGPVQFQEAIRKFIVARDLSGRPVAVQRWVEIDDE